MAARCSYRARGLAVVMLVGLATASAWIAGPTQAAVNDEIAFVRSPACYFYINTCYVLGDSIQLIRSDGSGERQLMSRRGWQLREIEWSPDGRTLAFGRLDSQLWRVEPGLLLLDVASGRLRTLVPNTQIEGLSWSPDGSRIAFSTWDGIEMVNADGTGRRVLDTTRAREPTWSPDCSEIAFIAGRPADSEIRALAMPPGTGGRVIRRGHASSIQWSPDGRRLAFVDVGVDDGRPPIRVIDAGGTDERPLAYGTGPSWSPDGRRLVFSDALGNLRTVEVDAPDPSRTERLVTLTAATGFLDGGAKWRPRPGTTPEPGVCDELRAPAGNDSDARGRRAGLRAGRRCSPRRQRAYRRHGFVCRKGRDGRYRLVRSRSTR